ncbi:MAG: Do family serine endopeptidase [Bacteroidia bacterium]|nr:Do family serine endopeptidase [Bacteroidia bacterium]
MKNILSYILVSLVISLISIAGYHFSGVGTRVIEVEPSSESMAIPANEPMPRYNLQAPQNVPADFLFAAETAMPAVVHIKSIQTVAERVYDPFYEFFGMKPRQFNNSRQHVSSGSGVILSPEGYIVTNNHVIKDADELEVTLNDNRSYKAKVIGTDPSTDLGLIKIDAENLSVLELSDSDEARVGEWVLAVGNPFSLASTATAGIVSAIGRDLEIIKDQMAIESFIQTDAAVNPGNSGGALVNLEGKLIGVNTAIASPTGTYAGYAFAVPANIVKKVISDLKQYGEVQRAFLGLRYAQNMNSELAAQRGLKITEGVLVEGLSEEGGSAKAGLKEGDVIVNIEGVQVKNDARLRELVGRKRPGDIINVSVYRSGKVENIKVQLTDQSGGTEILAPERNDKLSDLGIHFRDLTPKELERLGTAHGVLVSKLFAGKIRQSTAMKEEFIIVKVNQQAVKTADELVSFLNSAKGKVEFVGFYPRSYQLYSYTLDM